MPKKIKKNPSQNAKKLCKNPRIVPRRSEEIYKIFLNTIPSYMLQRMRKSLTDAYIDGAEEINWGKGSDIEILKAVDTIYIGGLEEFIKLNSDPSKPLKELRLASYRWYK